MEPTILPVKPGSLAQEDIDALAKIGVTVIYHDRPETLRLLRPVCELDSGDLLFAAMRALNTSAHTAANARKSFAVQVFNALEARATKSA